MASASTSRPGFRREDTADVLPAVELLPASTNEKARVEVNDMAIDTATGADDADDAAKLDLPTAGLQRGVQDAEAITLTWSRNALIAAFINMWMLYFVNAMQSTVLDALLPFVTSSFESHSELNVIYIVGDAMSAAIFIPLAKVMDVWGRAEGYLIMSVCCTVGLIMMASCNGLPLFCAAYVFYTIGFSGITFCVDVITADASTLKNRGLAYAFTSSPYIISAFAGSKAAGDFKHHVGWRWGFGCFAIIFPVVAAPLYFILKSNLHKASSQGRRVQERSGRTLMQNVWHYTIEFDIIGVLVFSAGLTTFLLPFNLAGGAPEGWATGYIIAMLVIGFVLLVSFGLCEFLLAPVPMFKFGLFSNRTVIGACLLDACYQISYYCWDNYFTSFLQVVNNLSVAEANYVNNTFNVVGGILCLLSGYMVRRTGRFKWQLYIAIPLYVFWQGLMIYFRRANQSVGYLVLCQVFLSLGGSTFIIIEQVAILAVVDHQHVAAVLALLNVIGTIGGALGAAVSGAIWTNTFLKALGRNLPASVQPEIDQIYENLNKQISYPVHSVARLAIQKSYAFAQTRMLAAGTGVMALPFLSLLLIDNINVAAIQQVRGLVF